MKHYEVVGAVLCQNGRILGMQRGPGKNPETEYKYEFPGGKIEPGETGPHALERELREEMDLDVTVAENDYYATSDYEYGCFSVSLHVYICRVTDPVFRCREHIGFKWLSREELLSVDWAPADYPILMKMLREPDLPFLKKEGA